MTETSAPLPEPNPVLLTDTQFDRTQEGADITSDEGKQQATMGSTALGLYLQRMGEMQVDAMERLYSATVDGPCHRSAIPVTTTTEAASTADRTTDGNACVQMSGCQQTIEHQLDIFTHCRQPLELFPFLHAEAHREQDASSSPTLMVGMYTVPLACEYCGASSTLECGPECQRPKLYFQKKRPPFAKKEGWDAVTEYEVKEEPPLEEKSNTELTRTVDVNGRRPSWVTGLFGARRESTQ